MQISNISRAQLQRFAQGIECFWTWAPPPLLHLDDRRSPLPLHQGSQAKQRHASRLRLFAKPPDLRAQQLQICVRHALASRGGNARVTNRNVSSLKRVRTISCHRSEEHTSELQSHS